MSKEKNRPAFLWDNKLKKVAKRVGNMIRENEKDNCPNCGIKL